MKHFAALINALDSTTKTNEKLAALVRYLEVATPGDSLWAVALLTGKRPRRPVNTRLMREWAAELSGLPNWLFEESYFIVGDLAETVALVLPPAPDLQERSFTQRMEELGKLRKMEETAVKEYIQNAWMEMDRSERFVFNKLITGGFRIGVSQKLMVRALAKHLDVDENILAHRLMGDWSPTGQTFDELLLTEDPGDMRSKPYPFYLAYPLEQNPEELGPIEQWQVEWKWDGIRGQLIRRKAETYVWSRGEELVTDQYPELIELGSALPIDCVIDGEIMAFAKGRPLPFSALQKRLGRKTLSKAVLQASPVKLIAYDLLELEGRDLRETPLAERRNLLEKLIKDAPTDLLLLSTEVNATSWSELAAIREKSREKLAEGLMLKRRTSTYKVGRKRGDWWKWKVDPLAIDAVMIYAMRGHGRRANLYTDYTFAVWDGGELVPFAKAYSGLTDKEITEVDRYVKKNTIERFGPVRSVKPELVFEIGFEGIAESSRHKSGIALRFPRILRWRKDKPIDEANSLDDLKSMLNQFNAGGNATDSTQ